LLTAFGLTPSGSNTVHIYTQTIHRTTQLILEACGSSPVFASYILVFALQLRKQQRKTLSQGRGRECVKIYLHSSVNAHVAVLKKRHFSLCLYLHIVQ